MPALTAPGTNDPDRVALEEIDELDEDIRRFRAGLLSPADFRPRRTLLGVYGQRQHERYMLRLRVPQGRLAPEQLTALAHVADRFGPGFCHLTTRQNVEYHFVRLEAVPAALRELAAVGISGREAGGNIVRNVACDPLSGVCPDALFDVTPHAEALSRHFLRNPAAQSMPRKVKVGISGCACDHALTWVHDIGAQAVVRDGEKGFRVLVGGGLGALPRAAEVLEEFVREEELVPLCEAVVRVFQRTGDRRRKERARLKFVLERIGIEEFRRLVDEERRGLPDHAAPVRIEGLPGERPRPAASAPPTRAPAGHGRWREACVRAQAQEGFAVVTVALPAGRISSAQLEALAEITRRFGVFVRATDEQNIVLRWAREDELPALHAALAAHDLALPTAGTLLDPVACPGAECCASALTNAKAMARALTDHLERAGYGEDPAARAVSIRISGCPNACSRHPVADIGLAGGVLHVERRLLPVYRIYVRGDGFGRLLARVPAHRVPQAVAALVDRYRALRDGEESFRAFVQRAGLDDLRAALGHLVEAPLPADEPGAYVDWEASKAFSLDDRGEGECAA